MCLEKEVEPASETKWFLQILTMDEVLNNSLNQNWQGI
jgi:hypothetical protein